MMTRHRQGRRGQVLIMVTLALFTLLGMVGLVVDLGWSYYRKKAAQAAADAAALAAVRKALVSAAGAINIQCGGSVVCAPSPVPCPAAGNLASACLYAAQNGFTNGGRQTVTVQASDRFTAPTVLGCSPTVHHPPTAPCVDTYYWVTVRISERIPQLFSAILGNREGGVSARATAAVGPGLFGGQLQLLNRENDPWLLGKPGNNLINGGGPTLRIPGGIVLSSAANGDRDAGAAYLTGNSTVESPFTIIRRGGKVNTIGTARWVAAPTQTVDSGQFRDPFSDRGSQPPILNRSLPLIPVPGGVLNSTVCPGGVCRSGIYYAYGVDPACGSACGNTATGDQLVVSGNLSFEDGAFGQFIIFGGLKIGQSVVNFGPGQYVFGGTKSPSTFTLDIDNKALITGGNGTDAGRIFIFTDSNYPGLSTYVRQIERRTWPGPGQSLTFAKISIKTGNNAGSSVTLYGLNRTSPNLPPELLPFAPVLTWQDQRNSYVRYNSDGTVAQCPDLANPCLNSTYPGLSSDSPQMELWATPYTNMKGVIYQPRGAWAIVQASGTIEAPIQLVTGAMKFQGNGTLTMAGINDPIVVYGAALVE